MKDYWGSSQRAMFNAGTGYWALNLFVQERPHESVFDRILKLGQKITEVAGLVGVLGIPAISETALHATDRMYGILNALDARRTHYLYKAADTPLAVTKDGLQKSPGLNLTDVQPLYLRSGISKYIAVPWAHTSAFEQRMGKLTLKQNYLVPQDSKDESGPGLEAATQATLADVTYLVLSTATTPISLA
ncbi:MAG: hypothetical protein JO316_07855 [Abitibacteriaceae bacterium]|nr:hypothetical protein [Abditibacteriaceae bacterium]